MSLIIEEGQPPLEYNTTANSPEDEYRLRIKSANDLVVALLCRVVDDQWSGRCNIGWHGNPVYRPCCPECHALEEPVQQSNMPRQLDEWHQPDCTRKEIIDQARAYLRAENELAVERGEEEEWDVP